MNFSCKKTVFLFLFCGGVLLLTLACGTTGETAMGQSPAQEIPLDAESFWPKFRANPEQTGITTIKPVGRDAVPWEYRTGKGIFSSPVIDGEGNIYIGSADHYFYCLDRQGFLKWKFATGEIIDSSALLDDRGFVYFGSGDQKVYCLDRATGDLVWSFEAHTPEEVQDEYGIKTYNVAWFEGNISMLPGGDLLAPNDNYLVYRIDRETGTLAGIYPANEMIWSAPAVNRETGMIYFGSTYSLFNNVFGYHADSGKKIWNRGGMGSNAASPLLTEEQVILGGYDGFLRSFSQKNGRPLWEFGTRGHIYASPALLPDGTLVQASTDGTIYGIDPREGTLLWTFDTLEPIRSSPAVDGKGQIYFGSGSGFLYCLNQDGTLRWKYLCTDENRNDLNGSPALGPEGVVIAGESGGIHFIPYDYPLTQEGRKDVRSHSDRKEELPEDGTFLIHTSPFGGLENTDSIAIPANYPVTFSLAVRQNNQTIQATLDRKKLNLQFNTAQEFLYEVGGDGTYLTIIPKEIWKGEDLTLRITGEYRVNQKRLGLFFWGGKTGGSFDDEFTLQVNPARETAGAYGHIPRGSQVLEISRLSCPYPTMLPSYNQIGFDSLHYLAGLVEGTWESGILWVIPGKFDESTGKTVTAPDLKDVFTLDLSVEQDVLTLSNYTDVSLSFLGSWDMPFSLFRLAGPSFVLKGEEPHDFAFNSIARGDDIKFYGRFLKLAGLSDRKTGRITVSGGAKIQILSQETNPARADAGEVSWFRERNRIRAVLSGSKIFRDQHVWGILLIDSHTGEAVPANYAREIRTAANEEGFIEEVSLEVSAKSSYGPLRIYLMMDTQPLFITEL